MTDARSSLIPPPEGEERGWIQGKRADSKEEWWVAVSLSRLGWSYEYQAPFFTGRRVRGGTVVDFLVSTLPLATALFIDSGYWHRKKERDRLPRLLLMSEFAGRIKEVISITDAELTSQEHANDTIRKYFGRAA